MFPIFARLQRTHLLLVGAFLGTFVLGGVFSEYVWSPLLSKSESDVVVAAEKRESGYKLINPLLECEYLDNQGNSKLFSLKEKVETVVKEKPDQKISLYYRDLRNGPWYGYNEQEMFAPQSLLKLPVVLAYFKLAEDSPELLAKVLVYDEPIESNLAPEYDLVLGTGYTVEELLVRTLTLSDNIAFNLLVDNLPTKFLKKVHDDLAIVYPSESTPSNFVSVRSYSSIFRVLYNSSYLTRKHSEFVLSVLAESEFDEGLVAGAPADVIVAHKFGLKNAEDSQGEYQLHDCGVVYHAEQPYVICVMTRGENLPALKETIRELSETVYRVVEKKID